MSETSLAVINVDEKGVVILTPSERAAALINAGKSVPPALYRQCPAGTVPTLRAKRRAELSANSEFRLAEHAREGFRMVRQSAISTNKRTGDRRITITLESKAETVQDKLIKEQNATIADLTDKLAAFDAMLKLGNGGK